MPINLRASRLRPTLEAWNPEHDTWPHGWRTAGFDHSQKTNPARVNRNVLRRAIARELTGASVEAGVSTQGYDMWSVMDEPTLDERPDFWRLELVSRCMTTNTDWQGEITKVFQTLQRIGETQLTTGCSMHVHVPPSREGNSYKPEQLHSIMKAVAYFDRAVTAAVPPDRKDNEWAASNFQKGSCAPRYAELYSNMSSLTWGPLFQEFDRIRLPALIPINVFKNKYVSWNFKHLGSECGTVEFRRPPGVKDARSALYWVAFTLGFLEGAMGHDWSNMKEEKTHGAFLDLRIIIRGGLKRLGPSCAGIIDNMDDIREEKSQPTPATRQEKEVIAAKKREKLDKESNFAVKVNSRPSTPASASASS
ncbi:amidoligase domain protein [Metarhizium robertsii]|uniref:Amidoligase domain protein n=1 Tax=Metarhizium robertsii TaxID=568076 RepID=A0A0A1UYT6_9HYPO|nr:amidoligase domain protein [Metarhizium robertsii]